MCGIKHKEFPQLAAPPDERWDPNCDISEPNDNIIDYLDLDVFGKAWTQWGI